MLDCSVFGKLSEPIDPSCPENEVVVPLCEDSGQNFSDAGRAPGDQGNGAVGRGMGFDLHIHSVQTGDGLVGTKWLLYPFLASFLAFVLDLFASWSSNLLSAARRCFCQVIMAMVWLIKNPRQPSSNPLFRSIAYKSRQR